MRLTPEVEKTMNESVKYAREHKHEFVTLEHILLALVDDVEGADIITGTGGDLLSLKNRLAGFLDKHCPKLSDEEVKTLGDEWKPSLTLSFHRTVQRALIQVESSGKKLVTSGNLLISMFDEPESYAISFLEQQGITRFDCIQYFSHGIQREEDFAPSGEEPEGEEGAAPKNGETQKATSLEGFAQNLNERAKKGLVDPLIGREDVLERIVQVLARRTKNNVLLVGDPGVGKTAIADGLALRIVEGKVPSRLKDSVIYSLDLGALISGTKYRGDFEQRIKGVVKEISEKKGAILFIDEMHTLVGAGATSGGSMDASNILKPHLANRTLCCIGSTTYKEFRNHLEKDAALLRRFQKIDIKPPSVTEAVQILEGLKSRYEDFHHVNYPSESIKAAVELSDKYIHARPLPDKAIDVMDEAGARIRLRHSGEDRVPVLVEDIERVVASVAQIPSKSISQDDKSKLKDLEGELRKVIFGQDKAVHALSSSIKMSRTGLGSPTKPIGCYLFTGPTGVGKTEVSKQLARILGTELLRFDMSEYMEKHAVSRLVGAPPGYVGYDEGGLLTETVSKNPYAVLLLDEMEKAHPDIANVLLQVMDNGKLTDSNGKVVDFRNVILIMTSNAGARELAKQGIGIQTANVTKRSMDAIKNAFAPEFLNRLDAVISFDPLPKEILLQVISKGIVELQAQLKEKEIVLEVSDEAKELIFEKAYEPAYGARPFARAIDEKIKRPMVDEILFGKLSKGGTVKVGVTERELVFTYSDTR